MTSIVLTVVGVALVLFPITSYNRLVRFRNGYENTRESFPTNLVAGAFGFEEAACFVIEEEAERETPRVEFGG